jgi:lysine 2,3-aminomutase
VKQSSKQLRSLDDLAVAGLVADARDETLQAVARRYAIAVTPGVAALIDRDDPDDPIARQFVPDARELVEVVGERADPIGDHVHEKVPGLVHLYPDRVLLKVTHACPVYCRFCFRREMVGPGGPPPMTGERLAAALEYIRAHPEIFEVILTGGDPLVLAPRRIADIVSALDRVPHVQVLRWHTRVPVVDPEHIDDAMAGALAETSKTVYLAVHANHPRELTPAAEAAIARLRRRSVVLLSQTVLLKGVNNDAATLAELFRRFVAMGVRPYYLHHADLAPGTSHFRTSVEEGQALMKALRGRITGLALPTYVLDIPGGFGKVPIGPSYLDAETGAVTDPAGRSHDYT